MSKIAFSFRPIEELPAELPAKVVSPIFRDGGVEEEDTSRPMLSACRAHPVRSSEHMEHRGGRVISPFSHTASTEEIEEREQLWAMEERDGVVDYSTFFAPNTLATDIDVMDCSTTCDDDLSLTSNDDLSEGFCVGTVLSDPAFWEEGIDNESAERVHSSVVTSLEGPATAE